MPATINPRLLDRVSVYQDIRWAGTTLKAGQRDCNLRWQLIRPMLPERGALLDVGSNFGWFGLAVCEAFPDFVVASVEADEHSAGIQRQVLSSHHLRRIALLTQRAGRRMAEEFARSGQRFDAVLCLSVLHWMPDHREFLTRLAAISGRMFIEHPDPRERGAGVDAIRRQIGLIGHYLRQVLPGHSSILLGRVPSERQAGMMRELWMVEAASDWRPSPAPALEASALLNLAPSWPPQSWWREQTGPLLTDGSSGGARYQFTPCGVCALPAASGTALSSRDLRRRLRRLPENGLWPIPHLVYRRARRLAGKLLRLV